MRKLLLSLALICSALFSDAQPGVVSTFDTIYLSKADTFYTNTSAHMVDLGFNDALAHFPYYYDTSFGGLWSNGFIYSNMTDSVTSGYQNMYSAKTATGYNNSGNYAIYWQGYGGNNKVKFIGAQYYKPKGFYITNSTYTYNAIRDGYGVARKFGDTTGTGSGLPQGSVPDWFKLTVSGYSNGAVADTVEFYLADYRFANDAQDYIIRDWTWLDLQKLGFADSLDFQVTSSDNHPLYGMNTPGYFCMDDLTVIGLTVSVNDVADNISVRAYPNPATDRLFVELGDDEITTVTLMTMEGKALETYPAAAKLTILTTHLAKGMYLLQFNKGAKKQSLRFIRQ